MHYSLFSHYSLCTHLIHRSVFLAAAVILAIALGTTLGGSSNNDSARSNATGDAVETSSTTPDTTISNDQPTFEDVVPNSSGAKEDDDTGFEVEYLESVGPIPSRVRMANPTLANGYSSCVDMKDDILNALKYHFNSIIVSESGKSW